MLGVMGSIDIYLLKANTGRAKNKKTKADKINEIFFLNIKIKLPANEGHCSLNDVGDNDRSKKYGGTDDCSEEHVSRFFQFGGISACRYEFESGNNEKERNDGNTDFDSDIQYRLYKIKQSPDRRCR